jgi:hypothetical protein
MDAEGEIPPIQNGDAPESDQPEQGISPFIYYIIYNNYIWVSIIKLAINVCINIYLITDLQVKAV